MGLGSVGDVRVAGCSKGIANRCCGGVHLDPIDCGGSVGERDVGFALGREHVDVTVRHFEAGDDDRDTRRRECCHLCSTDPCRHIKHVSLEFRRGVKPMIDLLNRNDEGVAFGDGVDRQEHAAPLVSPNERAWNLAGEDHGEDRGHGQQARAVLWAR